MTAESAPGMANPEVTSRTADAVEIRRNVVLNGVVGAIAAAMAIAYVARATGPVGGPISTWVDWGLCLTMAWIALVQFVALMDARAPLVIADDGGVRLRLGAEWVGLPWLTISQVVTEQRDLPWREGRLVIVPRNLAHVLEDLGATARREVRWQRRLHGAELSVPLSLFTRSSSRQLVHDLKALAEGRAEVVGLRGRERARLAEQTGAQISAQISAQPSAQPGARELPARGEAAQPRAEAVQPRAEVLGTRVEPSDETLPSNAPRFDPVAAVRAARSVMRADVVRDGRPRIVPKSSMRFPGPMSGPIPAPLSAPDLGRAGLIDDVTTAVVADPVIGPQIRAARTRAGLSVDQLSERTRIRPHVLEGIEVDDFGPCGGDFYARGHLSMLARYLGLDAAELTRLYDEHYASGPINARRVFEAELATGLGGGLRATSSGPRWSLLIGAALSLTMIWGVARYFTEEPAQIVNQTVSDSAGLSANRQPITSPLTRTAKVSVKAVELPVRLSILDRTGEQVFRGRVEPGERISVVGVGPFEITASNSGHARVWLDGSSLGSVGQGVEKAHRRIG